jgi:hypothetical protein
LAERETVIVEDALRKHVKALTLDIGPPKIASPARTGSSPSRQLPSMTLCLWEAIGHAASAEFLLVPLIL